MLLPIPTQHDHPYISAMVNNGSVHYDHDRDGTHSQMAGCSVSYVYCVCCLATLTVQVRLLRFWPPPACSFFLLWWAKFFCFFVCWCCLSKKRPQFVCLSYALAMITSLCFSSGEISEFPAGYFCCYFIHQQTSDGELPCTNACNESVYKKRYCTQSRDQS